MPTSEPNNAPLDDPDAALVPKERDNAAAVLRDDASGQSSGGGALGGAAGVTPDLAGKAGGAAPNVPIDTGLTGEGSPERESQRRAVEPDAASGGRSTTV